MSRPPEYDNLLRIGHFKPAAASRESIEQFVRTAEEMQAGSQSPMPNSARFFLACEGMFSIGDGGAGVPRGASR